ncbi:2,3-bisphosphoglycerate-independent phosphoglycerate mutase [Vibrio sp. 1S139]|uniref:2,3-bisphosphoglycerate-independent phosphoglycerate mutase n=1 Tax=Vibrio sp. 1S139 TaxID=3230006 RepID=UPI00352F75D5
MKKQMLLVIADGMGDLPLAELDNKTPLEYANTQHLARLAAKGLCGSVYPVTAGVPVGTDVGHLAIFGYDPYEVYNGRGPIEAYGAGIDLQPNDIAFRGNFATVSDEFTVLDRRAGRINEDTLALTEALDGMVLSCGAEVIVKPLSAHRVAVVLRGANLSPNVTETDPGTAREGEKVQQSQATTDSEEAVLTAAAINELCEKMYAKLSLHPINAERVRNGKPAANMILLRGIGTAKKLDTVVDKYNVKAGCVAGDRTVLGIARMAGLDTYHEESFTAGFDTNYIGKADAALKMIHGGYDWVVLHVKAPDLAGHDNLAKEKVRTAEKIDSMIGYMLEQIDQDQCYFSFTSDHSTPCSKRDHSGHPVPTLLSGPDTLPSHVENFGERYVQTGSLQNLVANDFFKIQMDYLGKVKKLGA